MTKMQGFKILIWIFGAMEICAYRSKIYWVSVAYIEQQTEHISLPSTHTHYFLLIVETDFDSMCTVIIAAASLQAADHLVDFIIVLLFKLIVIVINILNSSGHVECKRKMHTSKKGGSSLNRMLVLHGSLV